MIIQDAIKSNKRFKRKHSKNWLFAGDFGIIDSASGVEIRVDICDLIADDWETEEKKITISLTKNEFLDLYKEALTEARYVQSSFDYSFEKTPHWEF